MSTELANRPPFSALDTIAQLAAIANETSEDERYLQHEFVTYQGWWESSDGYTPPEAREAVLAHLRGWMYQSASLARHCLRQAYISGALARRSAPTLRTQWSQNVSDRGPKWAGADLDDAFVRQFRPGLEEKLRDVSMLGGSILHIHYIDDVKAGVRRPRLKRWPHEAIYWRAESPGYPGGYYAVTSDSGLVRITPGDGHWAFIAHGERWHEFGAILSLGEIFPPSKLAERDEAGLSEAAGRASPWATLPEGVPVGGPVDTKDAAAVSKAAIGGAVQKMVAGLGRARTGAVVPFGTKIEGFEITSDTQFFDRYSLRQLMKIGYAIMGIPSPGPGAESHYTPIVGWSVDEALVDKDHEAIVRAWNDGVARPFCDVNGIDAKVCLVGERYASPVDKAKAEADREEADARRAKAEADRKAAPALALAAWTKAAVEVFEIGQADVDEMAAALDTPSRKLNARAAALDLAPTDIAKVVKVDEARASRNLGPLGDERGKLTIMELEALGKAPAAQTLAPEVESAENGKPPPVPAVPPKPPDS